MMDLSRGERRILAAMSEEPDEWWYGLDLFNASGFTGFKAGLGYVALAKLEQSALIESRWENPEGERPRRRVYKLTENGRRVAIDLHEAARERRSRPRRILAGLPLPRPI